MARNKTAPKSRRLNCRVNSHFLETIEGIRVRTRSDNASDVVRRAIYVYEMLLASQKEGAELILRQKDGTEKQLLSLEF